MSYLERRLTRPQQTFPLLLCGFTIDVFAWPSCLDHKLSLIRTVFCAQSINIHQTLTKSISHFTQYCNFLCSQPLFSHLNCSKHLLRTQSAVCPLSFPSFPFPAPFFFLLPLSPFFCMLVSATSRVLCSHSPDQC